MTITKRVIALRDSDRIERFLAQPQAEGFVVFDAVDGRKGEGRDIFEEELFKRRYGFDATGPIIGCAASHYYVLSDFGRSSKEGEWLVVAEDDAVLSKNFCQVIEALSAAKFSLEYILLADPYGQADRIRVDGQSEIKTQLSFLAHPVIRRGRVFYLVGHYAGVLYGTGLYMVSGSAARKYTEAVERVGGIHWVADDYAYWNHFANLDISRLRPNLAGWYGASTIQDEAVHVHAYPEYTSWAAFAKSMIGLRTRISGFRNSMAATLRDAAQLLEVTRR